MRHALLIGSLVLLGAVGIGRAALPPMGLLPSAITDPDLARSDYVENCGGCHGVQGSAAPAALPELRGASAGSSARRRPAPISSACPMSRSAGSGIISNWPT
ncbi:hypothetical protein ACFSUK_13245 [Sphingobium scionense]